MARVYAWSTGKRPRPAILDLRAGTGRARVEGRKKMRLGRESSEGSMEKMREKSGKVR